MFGALIGAEALIVCIIVVGIVGYDIYQTPPEPYVVYAARVVISGTGHFQGDVGTPFNAYTVHGTVSQGSPITIEVPYRRADYVSAYVRWADGASGTTKIRVACRTVAERTAHVVMWKVPRNWEGAYRRSDSRSVPKAPCRPGPRG